MLSEQTSTIINNFKKSITNTYVKSQQKFIKEINLKPGDKVKVFCESKSGEYGWNNNWTPKMSELIGRVGVVKQSDNDNHGIKVYYPELDDSWFFPFFVLEKVSKSVYKFKDKEVVLVRDKYDEPWHIATFYKYHSKSKSPYLTYAYEQECVDEWKHCISYIGNEHLLETTRFVL